MCEAVTKPVPSAKADSIYSTFDSRYCRTGLSHPATARLEHRFVPPPVLNVEFRNSLERSRRLVLPFSKHFGALGGRQPSL